MINFEIVKHIVKTEFSWRKKIFKASLIGEILIILIIALFGISVVEIIPLMLLFLVFIPILAGFESTIIQAFNYQGNSNNQAGCFSWNYLHSTINDPHSFIFGIILVKLLFVTPPLLLGVIILQYAPTDMSKIFASIIPFYLFVIFLGAGSFLNVIQAPRRYMFQYNSEQGIRGYIKRLKLPLIKFYRLASYLIVSWFFVSFFLDYGFYYGIIALTVNLIVLNYILYNFIIKIWTDERVSNEAPSFFSLKILIRTVLIIILAYAQTHFHGSIFDNTNDLFNDIQKNNFENLKKSSFKNDINEIRDDNGRSLIHSAAFYGRKEIVDFFLANGSSLESKITDAPKRFRYTNGMTPLLLAIFEGQNIVANFLIEKGADMNARSDFGHTAFSIATFRCNPEMMKVLVDSGADWNQISPDGVGPYFYATKGSCFVAIEYLKKLGADESLTNKEGQTYLEYAKEKNQPFYRELMFYQTYLTK